MLLAPPRTDAVGWFSRGYAQARERFLEAAGEAMAQTDSWQLEGRGPAAETLAIDVCRWGSPAARRWLLLTSGLHGTEALLGSAVQLGFLSYLRRQVDGGETGVLFLHGLNPYGFAWRRRNNEVNIDLNRNFLLSGQSYQGAHPLYRHVYARFDPAYPPGRQDVFLLKAWLLMLRHGAQVLRASLPIGQYEYPRGLFFGGQGPAPLQAILRENLPEWVGAAEQVVHLDFHTGLGRWGDCHLLVDASAPDDMNWYRRHAPSDVVEYTAQNKTAYAARGTFGPWMKQTIFPQTAYHYAAVEFGTYSVVRVIKALFDELHTHFATDPSDPRYELAKSQVMETFVPSSPQWRSRVLERAMELCRRCYLGLRQNCESGVVG